MSDHIELNASAPLLSSLDLIETAAHAVSVREGLSRLQALNRLSDDFGFATWNELTQAFEDGVEIEMPDVVDEHDRPMPWIDLYVSQSGPVPRVEPLRSLEHVKRAARMLRRRDDMKYTAGLRSVSVSLGFESFGKLSRAFEADQEILLPATVDEAGNAAPWIDQYR